MQTDTSVAVVIHQYDFRQQQVRRGFQDTVHCPQ